MKTIINTGLGIVLVLMIGAVFLIEPKAAEQIMKEENLVIVPVPEQEEGMEHPDFIREEYIPQIPDGVNVALEGKIDASSFEGTFTPRKSIDGNVLAASYWEGGKDSYPNLLTLNLKETMSIHAVRICLCPQDIWGRREQTFSISVSSDGENFEVLTPESAYLFDPDTGNEAIIDFEAVETQYIQLSFTGNTGASGGQVAEFEVYSNS